MAEGIIEVPPGELKPHIVRSLLEQLRNNVIELRSSMAPISPPQNLKVTAQAFSNKVQWTRQAVADGFEVLWNSSASLVGAHVLDVGNSAEWTDNIGQQGITRFYWVRAYRKGTGIRSVELGPQKGTTLASATGIVPPTPPPPSSILVVDQRTGQVVPYVIASNAASRRLL